MPDKFENPLYAALCALKFAAISYAALYMAGLAIADYYGISFAGWLGHGPFFY